MNVEAAPRVPPGRDWTWSAEARVLRRPFSTYRELRETPETARRLWLLLRRPLFMLLCIGLFVSLSAAGRVVLWHVLFSFVFWAFGPIHQGGLIAALTPLFRPRGSTRTSIPRAIDLFLVGHGTWYLFLALIVAICLFSPEVYDTFVFLLRYGILPVLFLAVLAWSSVTTYAFFRVGLALPRGRAIGATVSYYVGFFGLIMAYYFITYQAQPVMFG